MTINAANVSEIRLYHSNTTKTLQSVEAFDSNGNRLVRVEGTPDRYGVNPADADIAAMLTAHGRATNPAVLYNKMFIFWDLSIHTYAETSAALALLPMDTAVKVPHQFMIDNNYFLRTNDPTNSEFTGNSGGQDNEGQTATHRIVELHKLVTSLPADPPAASVTYVGTGEDGWGAVNADLDGWSRRETDLGTPTASQVEVKAIASADYDGSVWTLGNWSVLPAIPGETERFTTDDVVTDSTVWAFTEPTDWTWHELRLPDLSWSNPIPRNTAVEDDAIDEVVELARIEFQSLANGHEHTFAASLLLSQFREFRWRWAQIDTQDRYDSNSIVWLDSNWYENEMRMYEVAGGHTSTNLIPYISSTALMWGTYGKTIFQGHSAAVQPTSHWLDLHFNWTMIRQSTTTPGHCSGFQLPRFSNPRLGTLILEGLR